jgi:hypothetical protein
MDEIATMEAATLSFNVPESSLPSHPGQGMHRFLEELHGQRQQRERQADVHRGQQPTAGE